jgi:2-polyprenyl-3-methyl-5-hydroxy-6-metoxy-1,4-benzoquinol methylase
MKETNNYIKNTSKNPVQKFLITNFRKTLFQLLEGLELEKVLDAGCGEGFILSELKKNNIGNHREGIEYSQEAIDIGKEIFPSLVFRQGDIYGLPYRDNSFDIVICTEVLEHLENPGEALDEIVRVSKRYCLFSVPNEPYFRIANFVRGKNLSRWGNDLDHVQCWSGKEFEGFVKTRLDVLSVKNPFPWTVVLGRKT